MSNDSQLNSNFDKLKDTLEQDRDIEIAIIFGSMATGTYTNNSDIDLAIKKSLKLTTISKIQLIEKVTHITGRTVDLIDLSTVGEPLLGQIIKYGKRLVGSNKVYADLALKHIYAQADFVPYIERALKERRLQWINS